MIFENFITRKLSLEAKSNLAKNDKNRFIKLGSLTKFNGYPYYPSRGPIFIHLKYEGVKHFQKERIQD